MKPSLPLALALAAAIVATARARADTDPDDPPVRPHWAGEFKADGEGATAVLRVGAVAQRMVLSRTEEGERFWIAAEPCTAALWTEVMGAAPATVTGAAKRVSGATLEEVRALAKRLGERVPGLFPFVPHFYHLRAVEAGDGVVPPGAELREWSETETTAESLGMGFRFIEMALAGPIWTPAELEALPVFRPTREMEYPQRSNTDLGGGRSVPSSWMNTPDPAIGFRLAAPYFRVPWTPPPSASAPAAPAGPDARLIVAGGTPYETTFLTFAPDGRHAATCAGLGVTVWDVAAGRAVRAFRGVDADLVAFSPDGARIYVVGGLDTTAWAFDIASGRRLWSIQLQEFNPMPRFVRSIDASPSGAHVIVEFDRDEAAILDAETGKEAPIERGGLRAELGLAFSPDGRRVLAQAVEPLPPRPPPKEGEEEEPDDREPKCALAILDLDGGGVRRLEGEWKPSICTTAFSPSGRLAAVVDYLGSVRIFDAATGRVVFSGEGACPEGVDGPPRYLAFTPDERALVAVSGLETWFGIARADLEAKTVTARRVEHWRAHVHAGGRVAVVNDEADAAAAREVLPGFTALRSHDVGGDFAPLAFDPEGARILSAHGDGSLRLHDARTGATLAGFQATVSVPMALAILPDNRSALVKAYRRLTRVDLASGRPVWSISTGTGGRGAADYARSGASSNLVVAPDGKHALAHTDGGSALIDVASGARRVLAGARPEDDVTSEAAFSPDGKQVVTPTRTWDVATGRLVAERPRPPEKAKEEEQAKPAADPLAEGAVGDRFERDVPGGRLAVEVAEDGAVLLRDRESGTIVRALGRNPGGLELEDVYVSPDRKRVYGTDKRGMAVWDLERGGLIAAFPTGDAQATAFAESPNGALLLTGTVDDGSLSLRRAPTGALLYSLVVDAEGRAVSFTPDGYYWADRGGARTLAFERGGRLYPVEQFDLARNRPDVVLERAGLAPPRVVAAQRRAWERRLERQGVRPEALAHEADLPEMTIDRAKVPLATSAASLRIEYEARDAASPLERLVVSVNDVPLHGRLGQPFPEPRGRERRGAVDVPLTPGANKIQVSVVSARGAESLRETAIVVSSAKTPPPALHLVAIGVSDYGDPRWNLTYAAKDARDLARALGAEREAYAAVKETLILDRAATRERIRAARQALLGSAVHDRVIVFVAGHGLLDEKLDYWFATADVDFEKPAGRGLPYGELEELVDGVPARNRLVLIDTCNSGEVDKDGLVAVAPAKGSEGAVKVRGTRGFAARLARGVGEEGAFADFLDLRRGTGAAVLTAAGGAEFSYESDRWKNGVFTYSVLEGLERRAADQDGDRDVTVSELHAYVVARVRELTRGGQHPTARVENVANDFALVATPEAPETPASRARGIDARTALAWRLHRAVTRLAFEEAITLDQDGATDAEKRLAAWRAFLEKAAKDDPFTPDDDIERAHARRRLEGGSVERPPWPEEEAAAKAAPPAWAETVARPAWAADFGRDGLGAWADVAAGPERWRFRYCAPGRMKWADRDPVVVERGFWLAESECPTRLWNALMAGGAAGHPRAPVTVSWHDAVALCARLSAAAGGAPVRLPETQEWEYAVRAGRDRESWDEDEPFDSFRANVDGGEDGARRAGPLPVKLFPPGAWGLFDLDGNLAEWCAHAYDGKPPAMSVKGNDYTSRYAHSGSTESADAREGRKGVRPVIAD